MQSGPSLPTNPSWPSLYNPRSELFNIAHHDPLQPGGVYLMDAQDIFRFTLYWTFVFYIPAFVVCGLYAFINLTFPPSREVVTRRTAYDIEDEDEHTQYMQGMSEAPTTPAAYPMTPLTPYSGIGNGYQTLRSEVTDGFSPLLSRHPTSPSHVLSSNQNLYVVSPTVHYMSRRPQKKNNECRTRLTFALLVLLFFLLMSLLGAVISSAIVGYVLAGLYQAGSFYMSTWIPFVWALIQVLVGMLNVWPSVIDFV